MDSHFTGKNLQQIKMLWNGGLRMRLVKPSNKAVERRLGMRLAKPTLMHMEWRLGVRLVRRLGMGP